MALNRTTTAIVGLSIVAGPVIGIASFALVAFVFPSAAWPLGLLALVVVPAVVCRSVGRRVGSPRLGTTAAWVAAGSSVVTAVALLLYAISQLRFE